MTAAVPAAPQPPPASDWHGPLPELPPKWDGQPPPATPTPGQAAYEAHAAMVVPRPWRWDQLDGKLRAAWEAAAQAVLNGAFPGLKRQLADARAERDALQRQLDTRNRQLAELQTPEVAGIIAGRANARAVVAEMIDWFWEPDDGGQLPDAPETRAKVARWRKRAGLEATDG